MFRRHYGHRVCVDNWEEDRHLEKDKEKQFFEKELKGELVFQKVRHVFEQLNNSTLLSVSTDGYVHFGDVIKLCHDGEGLKFPVCLASSLPFETFVSLNPINGPYSLVATRYGPATQRNSFIIKSPSNSQIIGRTLCYGEPFILCSTSEVNQNQFVSSCMTSFGKSAGLSGHQELSFVKHYSCYTMWRVHSAQPEFVLEMEGHPVPVNTNIVINHVFSNQDLAIENHHVRSLFGEDFEVSVHTYSNGPRNRDPHNLWRFQTQEPYQ